MKKNIFHIKNYKMKSAFQQNKKNEANFKLEPPFLVIWQHVKISIFEVLYVPKTLSVLIKH